MNEYEQWDETTYEGQVVIMDNDYHVPFMWDAGGVWFRDPDLGDFHKCYGELFIDCILRDGSVCGTKK